MGFVNEHEDVALRREPLRDLRPQILREVLGVLVTSRVIAATELVHQRTHQRRVGNVEHREHVSTRLRADDLLPHPEETTLYLIIQFGAVSDDQDAGITLGLEEPLGQPHHRQALARPLRVPDDATLTLGDPCLGSLDPEVLIMARSLLHPRVVDDEVMDELEEAFLGAHLGKRQVEVGVLAVLLPPQPVLLRSLDHPIAEPFDVVAREQELHGGEERTDEVVPLVADVLPDPAGGTHRRTLQLNDPECNAVDVEHQIGTLGVHTPDRDLLGHHELVLRRLRPVDPVDSLGGLPDIGLDLRAVPEQLVDLAILIVERAADAESRRGKQLLDRTRDQSLVVTTAE